MRRPCLCQSSVRDRRATCIEPTGAQEYCDGCAGAKAPSNVPFPPRSSTLPTVGLPLACLLVGAAPKSTNDIMQILDDYTTFGWVASLRGKIGATVVGEFRAWHASIKTPTAVHGELRCVGTDNGTGWVNDDSRGEGGFEHHAGASSRRCRRAPEQRWWTALVSEVAKVLVLKAMVLAFSKLFPDVVFPTHSLSFAGHLTPGPHTDERLPQRTSGNE